MANRWLDSIEYPFTSNYLDMGGHKLHYIDEGVGDILLFIHGTPSWSFDFRHVIKLLKNNYRCIAIDHIGFGLSDKPARYDYSTQKHSETLERFIVEKQIDALTLILHDFGGPIGLNFAIQHPDKINRLMILNSWLWSSQNDPEFVKVTKLLKSPFLPLLYRYLNFSAKFILPRTFGDHKLSRKLLKQYTRPFGNKNQRNGTVAFAFSLLNDQDWFEELWQKRNVLSNKPVLFIWGMKDPVIQPPYLDKFLTAFRYSKVLRLETSGHFPQEEQPEEVAEAMLDFLTDTEGTSYP